MANSLILPMRYLIVPLLLVANFLPGIPDVGYMESFMDWKLIYRNRGDMIQLADQIPQAAIRDIHIVAEENQNVIFLLVTKASERTTLNGCHTGLNGPHFAPQKHKGKHRVSSPGFLEIKE